MQINVRDYVHSGTYDRTTDIQQAINDCAAGGGGSVYLPTGVYPVTQLTLPGAITFHATNPYSTTLLSLTPDQDVLTVNGRGCRICNLGFKSKLPRTGGRYLYLPPSSRATYVDNFLMEGAYAGVGINTGATCDIEHGEIINGSSLPGSAGIEIQQGYDLHLASLLMDNPADQQPSAGIRVLGCGDLTLGDLNIIHCTNDLLIQGGYAIYASDCFFDTAFCGIVLNPQSPIERCRFLGCWTSSHTSHGVVMSPDAPASVDTVEFQNHHSFFNTGDGIHIGKGVNVKIEGSSCCANLSGIGVGGNARHVILNGNKVGSTQAMAGNQYGIYLIDPCDYVNMVGNDLLGNLNQNLVGNPQHFINSNNFGA